MNYDYKFGNNYYKYFKEKEVKSTIYDIIAKDKNRMFNQICNGSITNI